VQLLPQRVEVQWGDPRLNARESVAFPFSLFFFLVSLQLFVMFVLIIDCLFCY